jgi:hypothetical protein
VNAVLVTVDAYTDHAELRPNMASGLHSGLPVKQRIPFRAEQVISEAAPVAVPVLLPAYTPLWVGLQVCVAQEDRETAV